MAKEKTAGKSSGMRWQYRTMLIAVVVALLAIVFCNMMASRSSTKNDYYDALTLTSAQDMAQLEGYTGPVVISGTLTCDPIADETVEEDCCFIQREYFKLEKKYNRRKKMNEDTWVVDKFLLDEGENGQINGYPIDLHDLEMSPLEEYGRYDVAYKTCVEISVIKGTEVDGAMRGNVKNGEIVSGTFCVDANADDMKGDAALKGVFGGLLWRALMVVVILICGFVCVSMWLQRNDE